MDASGFEALAQAIERERRRDFWTMMLLLVLVCAGYGYLILTTEADFARDSQALAAALAVDNQEARSALTTIRLSVAWMQLKLVAPLMLFLLPFLFDRYRWRHDKALIALLRAQSKNQAS